MIRLSMPKELPNDSPNHSTDMRCERSSSQNAACVIFVPSIGIARGTLPRRGRLEIHTFSILRFISSA
jgi:hypothetical protein